MKKPINPAYPAELHTLGDHLRKVRFDRGLSQTEVANALQVSRGTVVKWELNRVNPSPKFSKSIISFLSILRPKEKRKTIALLSERQLIL